MSFSFKEFLTFEEVGHYLAEHGYSYDDQAEDDYYRLRTTILDLYNEKKINIVFHYNDYAVIKTLRIAENLGVEELKEEEFEFNISGYFHVTNVTSIFKSESKLVIREGAYFYYFLYEKDKLPIYDDIDDYKTKIGRKFTSIEFGDNIEPTVIDFCDLRYPKADLDKLFNEKNSELESIKDELADVKAQNAKLIADKEENKATGSFFMGTPAVAPVELETNKQLREALTAANNKIIKQAQNINNLNKQLEKQADNPADKHLYDWQAMDKNQYPPELHLTIEVWKKYYQAGDIEYITQFNTGKFNRIAKEFNLKDGNLKDRIRTLLTPLVRKLKAPSLIESFEVIDIIHTDKLEQD